MKRKRLLAALTMAASMTLVAACASAVSGEAAADAGSVASSASGFAADLGSGSAAEPGSDSGSTAADSGENSGEPSDSSPAAPGADSGSDTPGSEAPTDTEGADSAASSSGSDTPPASNSAGDDEAPDSGSAADSQSGDSPDGASSSDGTGATGALDDQTAAWFSTLCTGMSGPANDLNAAMNALEPGSTQGGDADPKKMRDALADALLEMAEATGPTAGRLASMPAPHLPHGEQRKKQMTTMKDVGPTAYRQLADDIEDADVSSMDAYRHSVQQAFFGGNDTQNTIDLQAFNVPPKTREAVAALPACQDMPF